MYKQKKLSHGLRLTQSDDMGIFLHFETLEGHSSGMRLDFSPAKKWAEEQLKDVEDVINEIFVTE